MCYELGMCVVELILTTVRAPQGRLVCELAVLWNEGFIHDDDGRGRYCCSFFVRLFVFDRIDHSSIYYVAKQDSKSGMTSNIRVVNLGNVSQYRRDQPLHAN